MLMVILGAGASYDAIPSRPASRRIAEPFRLPLADALFEAREPFEDVLRNTPALMPIVPFLQRRKSGQSVEDVLASLASEADGYSHRKVQMAAARFYLQAIIAQCEKHWYRDKPLPTNIMALFDQIERVRGGRERCIFVTFNYDRLIEASLANRGQPFGQLADFIHPDRTNVFKLHGSVDWLRPLGPRTPNEFGGGSWEIARQVCERIETLPAPGDIVHWSTVPGVEHGNELAIPAIAVPLKSKSAFECPPAHLDALKQHLGNVRTVLTVGWRGAEEHFLALLREHALDRINAICVGGSHDDASETQQNLARVLRQAEIEPRGEGFSTFVESYGVGRLLNLTWGPF